MTGCREGMARVGVCVRIRVRLKHWLGAGGTSTVRSQGLGVMGQESGIGGYGSGGLWVRSQGLGVRSQGLGVRGQGAVAVSR